MINQCIFKRGILIQSPGVAVDWATAAATAGQSSGINDDVEVGANGGGNGTRHVSSKRKNRSVGVQLHSIKIIIAVYFGGLALCLNINKMQSRECKVLL